MIKAEEVKVFSRDAVTFLSALIRVNRFSPVHHQLFSLSR